MKNKIKIWHGIIFMWLIVLLLCFNRIVELTEFLFFYIKLCITDFNSANNISDLVLADHLIGLLIYISVPFLLLTFQARSNNILNKTLFPSAFTLIVLAFAFIFAPIITQSHPDFYKDISVTKLLPPFSSVKKIEQVNREIPKNRTDELFTYKNSIVKLPYNDFIHFCDSLNVMNEKVVLYQKGKTKELPVESVKKHNDKIYQSKLFILGTDEFGRDILTRLIYGTRLSLLIGLGAVLISFILGIFLGFTAAFRSGWIDILLNRASDLFLAFPVIFLIIFILAFFGNNIISIIVVLGFSGWMSLFKLVKSEVSSIKKKDFFISSAMLGASSGSLLLKDVLPLIITTVVVNGIFQFGNVILAESALSYLGLGAGSDYPSWGSMIQSGHEHISLSWWMIILPSSVLIITLLTINDLGKKLNLYLNPRNKYD